MLEGRTLQELSVDLASGRARARDLVESALAAIDEDGRAFLTVDQEGARAAADQADAQRREGRALPPLAGIPISVKDLFDVSGQVTTAGSTLLAGERPAGADSPVIARLKAAGLIIIGRTQMSEFAFTGLGLNPHFPQPPNPLDPARAPGGSSGGAAVSVALGQAAMGLGTDTGGSVRIPAAFCGLTGFKPTQGRVSREGVFPLSPSLDSVGPIARRVDCCRRIDAVIADTLPPESPAIDPGALRLGLPVNYVLEAMEDEVAEAFERAVAALAGAGTSIDRFVFPELDRLAEINAKGALSNAEAFAHHRRLGLLRRPELYDPNVLPRIELGSAMGAADYLDLVSARADLIAAADRRTAGFDALIFPTTPILAPRLDDLRDGAVFARYNLLALRNPSLVNFLDRCAVSLPMPMRGAPPAGLTVVGETGGDGRLLATAEALERIWLE